MQLGHGVTDRANSGLTRKPGKKETKEEDTKSLHGFHLHQRIWSAMHMPRAEFMHMKKKI